MTQDLKTLLEQHAEDVCHGLIGRHAIRHGEPLPWPANVGPLILQLMKLAYCEGRADGIRALSIELKGGHDATG